MAVFRKSEPEKEVTTTSSGSDYVPGKKQSIVGRTLFLKGELCSDEEILVEGKIEGKLDINNRVIVGKSGVVNADIEARDVVIKGTVNGNVKGQNKVEIVPEGVLNGNIVSKRVVLAEGAKFKGNIDMSLTDE
jgi:cytoskeletal protein CcmA (bactofilin family)